MKLILEDIRVIMDADERPTALQWRLKRYRIVAVQERWRYVGNWWLTPHLRGQQRLYYRVSCVSVTGGATTDMEIYRAPDRWKLSRMLD